MTGLNGAAMGLGWYLPAHAKLKTQMGYITHLEHGICFPIYSWLINFCTIGNND